MVNPCKLCTAHCCKEYLITVTSFDVLRVLQKADKKLEEFVELSDPPMLNADEETILECYKGNERQDFVLIFKSHPCHFLGKNNECTIYENAPLGCRLYPFNSNGKIIPRALCPTIPKFLFLFNDSHKKSKPYSDQMQNYKKIVAKWNKTHGKKEDCLNFLLKETSSFDSPKDL